MTAEPLKLDLACGLAKKPGFLGVDIAGSSDADIVFDLREVPWPWADASVGEVHCAHFFEHLTSEERLRFVHELHRVLVPGGVATIVVPHAHSDGAIRDPTHQWPPLVEESFLYFDAAQRAQAKMAHYPIHCDFRVEIGVRYEPHWQQRPKEEREFARKHFVNVVVEITARLTKR